MKTLDDLKREMYDLVRFKHFKDVENISAINGFRISAVEKVIDHLHAQGRILPDGYVVVPLEPTAKQLDAAVAFALNVTLRKEYGWTNYTKDLYKLMIAAA